MLWHRISMSRTRGLADLSRRTAAQRLVAPQRSSQYSARTMLASTMRPRGFRIPRASMLCLFLPLLAAPYRRIVAQPAKGSPSTDWSAWAFGRLGPAKTSLPGSPIFGSLGGGVVVSRGAIVGMFRVTDNENTVFEDNPPTGEHDYAVLAGVRSRNDRLFVVGAAGLAQSARTAAPAFDLSAHADYRVLGLSLTASGVLGPPSARYVTISLGAELGWFGSR
jgi:hypothetical protein